MYPDISPVSRQKHGDLIVYSENILEEKIQDQEEQKQVLSYYLQEAKKEKEKLAASQDRIISKMDSLTKWLKKTRASI